jgi:hypothetical protein
MFPNQIWNAYLQWSGSYRCQTKIWRRISHICHVVLHSTKKVTFTKFVYFLMLYWTVTHLVQDPTLSGASVCPTSQVSASAVLLPTVGNPEVRGWGGLQWRSVYTKFRKHHELVRKLKWGYRHIHHGDLISLIFSLRKEIMLQIKRSLRIQRFTDLFILHVR